MSAWLAHLKSLKRSSIFWGVASLLISALFIYAMFRSSDYSVVPMAAALLASIFALAIFLPPRIANYAYGVIFVVFGARALVIEKAVRTSKQDDPLLYWLETIFLFVGAGVFLHAAYRARNSQVPPEVSSEPDAHNDTSASKP